MQRGIIPMWVFIAIIIAIAVGGYVYRGVQLQNNHQTTQSENSVVNIPSGNNTNNNIDLSISVTKADIGFNLEPVTENSTNLTYSLVGPKLTLNANTNAIVDTSIEVYDDNNNLVTSKNGHVYLQKGNQAVDNTSSGVNFNTNFAGLILNKPGKYSAIFKMSFKGKEIYTKTFDNLLVGINEYPIINAVDMQLSGFNHKGNTYNDEITFSLKLTNKGNSDIVGFYKTEPMINGVIDNTFIWYGKSNGNDYGFELRQFPLHNPIFLAKDGTDTKIITIPGNGTNAQPVLVSCKKKTDKIKVKVSFITVNLDNLKAEGKVLATQETPEYSCSNGTAK